MEKIENMGTNETIKTNEANEVNEANEINETRKTTFTSLTPDLLEKNKQVYTDALDYAFSHDDIRNIAITGVYGAGKSTVWNTYRENKSKDTEETTFKNIITVRLGKYEDNSKKNNSIKDDKEKSNNKKEDKELDNRVERQIINQISAQINSTDIPLSKYKLKGNISKIPLWVNTVLTILFSISIILLFYLKPIFKYLRELFGDLRAIKVLAVIFTILFIIPAVYFLFNFYKENKVKFSKISYKGTEAQFTELNNDETVLERDMKEIVYLLSSSETRVVVFEDLDRYDSVDIFVKLKELNFLLNAYLETNGRNRVIRFVYLIKDGLLYSKDRTKFFDFILPIVPIVDSKTSENHLIDIFTNNEDSPEEKILSKISLYIDDMRILRNIVNEYNVYVRILPVKDLKLSRDKLFAIITFKNIFPKEFGLLQKDKGYILDIFNNLEKEKEVKVNDIQKRLDDIVNEVDELENRIENNQFDVMSLKIPNDIYLYSETNNQNWSEILKKWSLKPKNNYEIRSEKRYINTSYNYETFLDAFAQMSEEDNKLITSITENKKSKINKLREEKKKLQEQLEDQDIYTYQNLILSLDKTKKDELFTTDNEDLSNNHYFGLIRFLIIEGLLDETIWYYRGCFEFEKSALLKKNDIIYLKGLLESQGLDIFKPVETPSAIIDRLTISDFRRANSLNAKILKHAIKYNHEDVMIAMTDSVVNNNKYNYLIKILSNYEIKTLKSYISILSKDNIEMVVKILDNCSKEDEILIQRILIAILTLTKVSSASIELFNSYIENNKKIISIIPESDVEIVLRNLSKAKFKFHSLDGFNITTKRLLELAKYKLYEINIRNLKIITDNVHQRTLPFGYLLSYIFEEAKLISLKEYILENFEKVVIEYIDECDVPSYENKIDVIEKIINSNISNDQKIKYLKKNSVEIPDLSGWEEDSLTIEMFDVMFREKTIKFTEQNINRYLERVNQYSSDFVNYLNFNSNRNNLVIQILRNHTNICNSLINDADAKIELINIIIKMANQEISELNSNLESDRIAFLITNDLVKITRYNVHLLIEKSYIENLVLLARNDENTVMEYLDSESLTENQIYSLLNSSVSDDFAMKLIDKLKNGVLIEKIAQDKATLINRIIQRGLSEQNIKYICQHFKEFPNKEQFIEYINNNNIVDLLESNDISNGFMEYVLPSKKLYIDEKIDLIIKKIKSKAPKEVIKEYLEYVDEISKLASVWDRKHPILDNIYKQKVADALVAKGYVKKRNVKENTRIMINR